MAAATSPAEARATPPRRLRGRPRRRRSSAVARASCCAALAATAAPDRASPFSFPSSPSRSSSSSRATTTRATKTTTRTTTTRATTTTALSAGLSSTFDSLDALADRPDLFPATSAHVRALSRGDGVDVPSPEAFLARLSSELLRASRAEEREGPEAASEAEEVDPSSTSRRSEARSRSPLRDLAEATGPALAAGAGVGLAAEGYDPASYARRSTPSRWEAQLAELGTEARDGVVDRPMEFASADYDAAAAAAAPSEWTGGGASESFAAWHTQGGSNALRDLASSIPTVEQYDASFDYDASVQQVASSGYHHGNEMFASYGYDAGNAANAYASSSLQLGDVAAVGADPSMDASMFAGVDIAADASAIDALAGRTTPSQFEALDGALSSDDLASQLSSQLSDLNYDGMHADASAQASSAAPDAPKARILTDYLRDKLSDVDWSPARSAIGDAGRASRERLDDLLGGAGRALDGLGDLGDDLGRKAGEAAAAASGSLDGLKGAASGSLEGIKGAASGEGPADASRSLRGLGERASAATGSLRDLSEKAGEAASAGASAFRSAGGSLHDLSEKAGEVAGAGAAAAKAVGAGAAPVAKAVGAGAGGMASAVREAAGNLHLKPPEVTLPRGNVQMSVAGSPVSEVNVPPTDLSGSNLPGPSTPEPSLSHMSLPHVDAHLPSISMPSMPRVSVGDASLSDFGNAVISSLKFLGGIVIKFLDLILGAVAGTSASSMWANLRDSVSSAVDNASHAVVSTMNAVGDMSLREVLQHLVALVVLVVDLLLKVANALVYVISGRDGSDWALQASTAANEAGSRLLARASETYNDVTHESLAELAHHIGDYSQHTGDQLMALLGGVSTVVADGSLSLDNVPLDADAVNNVVAAVQTALSL